MISLLEYAHKQPPGTTVDYSNFVPFGEESLEDEEARTPERIVNVPVEENRDAGDVNSGNPILYRGSPGSRARGKPAFKGQAFTVEDDKHWKLGVEGDAAYDGPLGKPGYVTGNDNPGPPSPGVRTHFFNNSCDSDEYGQQVNEYMLKGLRFTGENDVVGNGRDGQMR